MMADERTAVANQLRSFVRQIDELLELASESPLSRPRQSHAQDLLAAIKRRLRDELHDLQRRREALNHTERAYLLPALVEAHAHLRVPTNTVPDQRWVDGLLTAKADVCHLLYQLVDPHDVGD